MKTKKDKYKEIVRKDLILQLGIKLITIHRTKYN